MTYKLQLIITTILFTFIPLKQAENINIRLFLTDQETWLFFPHHQNTLDTYTATCRPTTINNSFQHPQFETISTLLVNNLCLSIDILDNPEQVTSLFYYAKLSFKGVCTVYQVQQSKISIYYEYNTQRHFDNVLMLNRLTTILWNTKQLLQIDYCLFTKKVNVYEFKFSQEGNRQCRQATTYSVICWSESEILFLNFSRFSSNITIPIPIGQEQITMILPMVAQQGIYYICEKIICNITNISSNELKIIDTYPFVNRILGGSVCVQTNSFMMISHDSIQIYTYFQFGILELKLQQSISLPPQFQCVNYDHSIFIGEMIIVQCFNFMGQQQKLVLLKDSQINKYIPYNPLHTLHSDCWLSGNYYYFFAVCSDSITTMDANFYYLEIKGNFLDNQDSFIVQLQCQNEQSLQTRITQYYNLNVTNTIIGYIYMNAIVNKYQEISYNLYISLRLKTFFKASNIIRYKVSTDCPFIKQISYESVHYMQYFSIYNRQKCVQIISGGGQLFYRLIEINETVFYLEECLPLKYGYGCQLSQIYQNKRQVRLGMYQYRLIKFYIKNGWLKMQFGVITKKIFDEQVLKLQILNDIIRVKTKQSYYFNSIDNIINNCGQWINQQVDNRYAYHQSYILQIFQNGTLKEYRNHRIVNQLSSPLFAFQPKNRRDQNDTIQLPCFFKKGYYIFIVTQLYITKVYARQKVIAYYSMPFNPQNFTISDIKMTDIYLTIQYQIGQFQIYDIQQQMISAKIATIQQTIMTDIILLDRDIILIPIKSETSLIKIQRDPFLSIGIFQPQYSRFQQLCNFTLEPIIQNGSCPNPNNKNMQERMPINIFQQFSLKIKYQIMSIDLGGNVGIQSVPDQCQNCLILLQQQQYKGPIFGYQLNDDYFQSFTLIPHLNITQCIQSQTKMLNGLFQVKLQGDFTLNYAMMTDGKNIYIIDSSLDVTSTYQMKDTQFCSSFIYINDSYLILCDKYFLLVKKGQPILSNPHNLTISSITKHTIQLLFQKINADTYNLYLLDHDINVYIYQLNIKNGNIKLIDTFNFVRAIQDMKIVNDKIIILKHYHLCLAQSSFSFSEMDALRDCFNLSNIIPYSYSLNYSYDQILPYYSSLTKIKVLIIGRNVDNLHIDLQISFSQNQTKFTIINAYAGYQGFVFKEFISLNITQATYSNFIILYQSQNNKNSQIIAYYRHNDGYKIDKTIGHIRSAQFLQNYFKLPFNFTFASFPNQMFITHHTPPSQSYPKNKYCLSVQVRDQLVISLNYKQAPPVKFIILKARNLNSINSHYIRVNFIPTTNMLIYSGIGVGVFLVLFVLLVIITNRCKTNQSDIEIHFMKEEIEEDNRQRDEVQSIGVSSLLHSKQSSEYPQSEQEHDLSHRLLKREG